MTTNYTCCDHETLLPWERVCPRCIWRFQQNNPELVVQDLLIRFRLPDSAAEEIRNILMNRGVNKWLLARRRMIDLKHRIKKGLICNPLEIHKHLQWISHAARWVLWPKYTGMRIGDAQAQIQERII